MHAGGHALQASCRLWPVSTNISPDGKPPPSLTDAPPSPAAGGSGDPEPPKLRPWASLAFQDFRLLWVGAGLGSVGLMMRQTVNLWLIYELSGSAILLGFTGLFQA